MGKPSLALLLGLLLVISGAAGAQEAPKGPAPKPWEVEKLDNEALNVELKSAEAAVKAIAAKDLEKASKLLDSEVTELLAAGWAKEAKDREKLLNLLGETIESRAALAEPEQAYIQEKLDWREKLLNLPVKRLPADADSETVSGAEAERDAAKADLDAAQKALSDHMKLVERFSKEQAELPGLLTKAQGELKKSAPQEGDELAWYRHHNLTLQVRTLTDRLDLIKRSKSRLSLLQGVLEARLDYEKERYRRESEYVKRLRDTVTRDFDRQARELDSQAVALAERARKQGIDEAEKTRLLLQSRLTSIEADIMRDRKAEQDAARKIEKERTENESLSDDLAWVEERLGEDRSITGRTAEILRNLIKRFEERQHALEATLRPALNARQEEYSTARADISDELRAVDRTSPDQRLVDALERRQVSIRKVITRERELDGIYDQREKLLQALMPIVIRRIYRLRSLKPISGQTLLTAKEEISGVADAFSDESVWDQVEESYESNRMEYGLVAAVFALSVALGVFLSRKLRAYRKRWSYRGNAVLVALQRIGASLLVSALGPAFLVLAAFSLTMLRLPPLLGRPVHLLIVGIAVLLFLRRFLWTLFRDEGILVTECGGDADAARQLLRASYALTAVGFVLALPLLILKNLPVAEPPRDLPRLVYILLLVALSAIALGLTRRGGPFVKALTGGEGFWYQVWFFGYPLFALACAAIVVMEAAGYHYGSLFLGLSLVQTLFAAASLVVVYRLVTGAVPKAASRLNVRLMGEVGLADARNQSAEATRRVTRFVGAVITLVAVVLLADFWGFDEQFLSFLQSLEWTVADQVISLWDVLKAIAWVVAGHYVANNLGVLYELLIFSQLGKVETGTRFAIVAISKYVVIVLGWAGAMLSLKLSFASMGYIFAALSVGIGFGLQEIVANFVSGLILFFERPVRVGDTVTVGAVSGVVDKISIRATQVINWDRQVIVIPNRQFITQEVINWTHNDQVIRSTIQIGVTYDSDVDKVYEVIRDELNQVPGVLKNPAPMIHFLTFGESALIFTVRPFSMVDNKLGTTHAACMALIKRLRKEGITIAFPQRDVHIRTPGERTVVTEEMAKEAEETA